MQVGVRLKHTWISQSSQRSPEGSFLLIRILEIVQLWKLSSTPQISHRRYWQFKHGKKKKKRYSGKQEKAKMSQTHSKATRVPSSINYSAYALHVVVRMPPTASTASPEEPRQRRVRAVLYLHRTGTACRTALRGKGNRS